LTFYYFLSKDLSSNKIKLLIIYISKIFKWVINFKANRPIPTDNINRITRTTLMAIKTVKMLKWITLKTFRTKDRCKWIGNRKDLNSKLITTTIKVTLKTTQVNTTTLTKATGIKISNNSTLTQKCLLFRQYLQVNNLHFQPSTWMWSPPKTTWNSWKVTNQSSTLTCFASS